jgi:hypothetical protein
VEAPVQVASTQTAIHRVAAIVPVKSDGAISPKLLAGAALVLLLLALASASLLRLALQASAPRARRTF